MIQTLKLLLLFLLFANVSYAAEQVLGWPQNVPILVHGSTGAAVTSGNCAEFDANGNIVDSGGTCGGGGGTGAYSDSADPVILNTTTKDVIIAGAAQKNSSKATIDGDADQVQLTIQGHTTQTTNIFVIEQSDGTDVMTGSSLGVQIGTDILLNIGGASKLNTTEITGGLDINLPAGDNITIDGSTNPRTIDSGAMVFNQKPAIENTRAITINLDIDSQATSHAQVVNIMATALAPGETATGFDVNVDRSTSTGGIIRGYEMSIAGVGTAVGHLMHADPGIVVLNQFSGTFINIEQAWDENGGFLDVTTAFNSTGTDVTLFNTNGDMVHIGMAAAFNQIQVNLATFAGGAGIKPVFEYSSGGGTPVWTVFTPQDETQGFRQTGVINWDIDDLVTPTWAVATANSVSKFYIRITRTQASIPTDPIEDTIQVVTAIVYSWDENGRIFAGSVITGKKTNTVTTEGNSETSQMIAHIDNGFSETIEHTLMRHSDTASVGSILYGIRSRGSHASQAAVQDNDVVFQLKVGGYDGTDYNESANIKFVVDGAVSGNTIPTEIIFQTSETNSDGLATRLTIAPDGNVNIPGLTASEIVITDGSKNIISAAVATYPSLAELIHVKGVSSAIQTQIDTKLFNNADDTTSGTLTAAGFIGNLYDAPGAVDLDIGSPDVLDVTVTTDGGSVVLDGNIVASGSITAGASATPNLVLDDSDDTGTEDISIRGNCPTTNDCDLTLGVNSGADTETIMFKLDTTDAGATTVQMGDPAGGNYINITEAGVMTAVGTASIPGGDDFWTDLSPNLEPNDDGDGIQINDSGGTDFVVQSHDGTDYNFVGTNTVQYTFDQPVKAGGSKSQIISAGTAPTGPTSCGTTPSISATATDQGGKITIGSTASSTCTITFNVAYTNAPACVVTNGTVDVPVWATTTTTTLIITDGAGDFSSDVIMYICMGQE